MAQIPDVIAGEDIETVWGNAIRDQTTQIFATAAERDAALTAPIAGQCCWADGRLQVYQGATRGWCVVDPAAQMAVAMGSVNPIVSPANILDTNPTNPVLAGRTQVSVAVNFTLHALDANASTWTFRIQVAGVNALDPCAYAQLVGGGVVAVSFTHLLDVAAGAQRVQVIATRTTGTGAARTFGQSNAMVIRY